MYYSGHRKIHSLHSQVINDNTGMIRHEESGVYGHQNNAQHYRLMTELFSVWGTRHIPTGILF